MINCIPFRKACTGFPEGAHPIIEKRALCHRYIHKYIDDDWNKRQESNIHMKIGESFELTNEETAGESQTELRCSVGTKLLAGGMELTFTVFDEDFYFSDIDDYDTLRTDGVHLLIYGTEKYSYSSIFFFPKLIDGDIKVIACNVMNNLNEVLSKKLVKTDFTKMKNGYVITATLSNEFIVNNHLNHYFYMGLVISDCDRKTGFRTNQIILSGIDYEWNNPVYFAKIEI